MLVTTITNNKKIAIDFCHPAGHRAKGSGMIMDTFPYRKTICELYEVNPKDSRERQFLTSATIRWPWEVVETKGIMNGKEMTHFTVRAAFKKGKGPKELMRLATLAKAVDKLVGKLSKDDKEKLFNAYFLRGMNMNVVAPPENQNNPMSENLIVPPKLLMSQNPVWSDQPRYIM